MSVEASAGVIEPPPARITEFPGVASRADRVFRGIITSGALTSLIILGAIGIFLFVQSAGVFSDYGFSFITGKEWFVPTEGTGEKAVLSIGPMLVGSLVVALIGLILAVPTAIGGALFIEFYAPKGLRRVLVSFLDLAAAIPSLIFGLWGIMVFTPIGIRWSVFLNDWFGWIPIFDAGFGNFGRSPFVAGCVLASMIVPITTSVAREVYSRVPRDLVDSCYALGASRWGMIRAVVLPFGRSGVTGGAMLGLGRALGETVAIYLLLNLQFDYSFKILDSIGGNVASLIANKFGEAGPLELKGLIAAGFVLFVVTLIVNAIATYIVQRKAPAR